MCINFVFHDENNFYTTRIEHASQKSIFTVGSFQKSFAATDVFLMSDKMEEVIDHLQMSIKCPTSGRQMYNQEAAIYSRISS